MKSKLKTVLAVIILLYSQQTFAQLITQTVRGNVFDKESQVSLPGANIIILNTSPTMGTITDAEGNFRIEEVPVGRHTIQVSFVGYDPVMLHELMVTSGKEVVLNISLKQSVTELEEATVKAFTRKDKALNSMASISARSFSVEETRRYAGGVDDPARMVSAFAGITVGNIQDNAIIVRGNAPKGVSWRLEGVDIPNPNHFAGGNIAGGGAVTIFSSQLLSNSDFFTGAFPAEYGNALAGVFDIKLRNGNSNKRESTVQAGMLGLDVSSEGPFGKNTNASYLFNYRYSTFGILSALNIIPSEQIPIYQDLSFKLNFPTQKLGTFSLWGIGAMDEITEPDKSDPDKWESDWDRISFDWNLSMGAVGLTHKITTGKKTYLNTNLATNGVFNRMDEKRLDDNAIAQPNADFTDNASKIILSTFLNHKFNSRSTVKTGLNIHSMAYDIDLSSTIDNDHSTFQNFVKEEGQSQYMEWYMQTKYDFTSRLSISGGANLPYFALNDNFSVDPRFGINWELHPKHTLSFGYGKHSQLEELKIYLIHTGESNDKQQPNKNLGFSKAQHFILGYDWLINNKLRLRVEPYYQYLYDIPGKKNSPYSFINFEQDWSFRDSLENNSKGYNLGIDFTLERFLGNNYYYLVTASVFDSKYKANDGIWRDTRFNKNYVLNVLVGKEIYFSYGRVLGLNGRINLMGGERHHPVKMRESLANETVIYDEYRSFEAQAPSMYYLDVTITYRKNKQKYSSVWALQLKNALGSPSFEGKSYNLKTGKVETEDTVVILPVLSYKIEF